MIFNFLFGIWCDKCKKYKDPYTEIYLPDGSENKGKICCLDCDNVLGYTWDKSWLNFWKKI